MKWLLLVLIINFNSSNYFTNNHVNLNTSNIYWAGIDTTATVKKKEEFRIKTIPLIKGKYIFLLSGQGGDADLYIKINSKPTERSFDCRPAKNGSNESCRVSIIETSIIHIMVKGYANSSTFKLVAKQE